MNEQYIRNKLLAVEKTKLIVDLHKDDFVIWETKFCYRCKKEIVPVVLRFNADSGFLHACPHCWTTLGYGGKPITDSKSKHRAIRRKTVKMDLEWRGVHACANCGKTREDLQKLGPFFYIERHHVVPLEIGGRDVETNIVGLCTECHRLLHQSYQRKM